MGFPKHIILHIKTFYENQAATVKTSYGLSDFFQIGQGVRQGCILSPNIFNISSEQIMKTVLAAFDGAVTVGGGKTTNLGYADDIVLISGSITELPELTNKVQMQDFKAAKAAKILDFILMQENKSYKNHC